MGNFKNTILLGLSLAALSSCGSPEKFFEKVIAEQGYIAYSTPLSSAGVGTIIQGSPDAMNVVAHPQRCFPDQVGNTQTGLRWQADTDLPNIYRNFDIGFGGIFSQLLSVGNLLASLNIGFNLAQAVNVEFDGASVEYLDQIAFIENYGLISDTCQMVLESQPFILQALRVKKMKFQFYQQNGLKLGLTPEIVAEMMGFGLDVEWDIKENYTLEISTPKYIGYQVGLIGEHSPGIVQQYAYELTRKRKFDFQDTDLGGRSRKPVAIQRIPQGAKPATPLKKLDVPWGSPEAGEVKLH